MNSKDPAEEICLRMAELRRELMCDVRDVGRSARAMTNISFYVRQFPWATLAVAAAAGYMLVPKKKQVVYPDPESLAELVRKNQVRVDATRASKESQGLIKTMLVMGLTWAARTGLNYVGQQLAAGAFHKPQEHRPPAPSPLEQPWQPKG